MRDDRRARCGRCGADPFAEGEPYTLWMWIARESGTEARALHLCRACGRDFPSTQDRGEYLRLVELG